MKNNIYKVHNIDARKIDTIIKDKIVDVTITSPPYFNLKDYGNKKQIGYSQKYEEYLEDIKLVFAKVFNMTKDTGTLWVIINTFRKNKEIVLLPFDFSQKLKESGWKLQEVIIWSKDRTVPWTHKGQMRHMFEYILVFSKSNKFNYYVDRVRDYENLKKWWVKYPERYNPKGKIPEEIWNFDIPTQGSWGNGHIKHFCPLPEKLVERIINLTTNENDVILDPFSGHGTVLAQADFCKRKYIGLELNKTYIKMFNNYLKTISRLKRKEYKISQRYYMQQDKFEKLILDLRILKFAKTMRKILIEKGFKNIYLIYVEKLKCKPSKKHKLVTSRYNFLIDKKISAKKLEKNIHDIILIPPLSKYGIEPKFRFFHDKNIFLSMLKNKKIYAYTARVAYKYYEVFKEISLKKYSFISPIKVDLNESDFE